MTPPRDRTAHQDVETADDPIATAVDRQALAAHQREERVRQEVKNWPPFTAAQRAKLAVLLELPSTEAGQSTVDRAATGGDAA